MSKVREFQPMLAGKCDDVEALRFPILASPKLDGIRAVVKDGVLLSRSLKPIPNEALQDRYGRKEYEGLDGELISGNPCDKDCFVRTQSDVMSAGGNPDVTFYIFDNFMLPDGFLSRLSGLRRWEHTEDITALDHQMIYSVQELQDYEQAALAMGYEGIMIRDPEGAYKFGRGTTKKQDLLKLKRFCDAEARVTGMVELIHQDGTPGGTLGAFNVVGINGFFKDAQFQVGTGFTPRQRYAWWNQGKALIGTIIKYKYFPSGSQDAPRFPVFLGFRAALDIGQGERNEQMITFYWNGIRANGGPLQKCSYSIEPYTAQNRLAPDTIIIRAKEYSGFDQTVRNAFLVENNTDIMTDSFYMDTIQVKADHQLYQDVSSAYQKRKEHDTKISDRWLDRIARPED